MGTENVAADRIEAQIDFVFDLHLIVHELMEKKGVSRAELASRLGISKARLSQLMRPEANPTARTMVDLFFALGERPEVRVKSLQPQARERASSGSRDSARDDVLEALFMTSAFGRSFQFEPVNENSSGLDFELAA